MEILITLVILVFSAILHEIAHGYVADRFGDPTARLMGRLTLDPRRHIDPFMSLILPFMLIISGSPVIFGGAKPVPVDPFNLRDGRRDFALVSLAGPLTNLILAIIAAVFIHLLFPSVSLGLVGTTIPGFILETILRVNLILAIFNLLPIPPLDGSKVFSLLLPEKQAAAYLALGNLGPFLLLLLLIVDFGSFSLQAVIESLFFFGLTLLGFTA